MSSTGEAYDKPSKVTKDRLSQLVQQEVIDVAKLAKHVCQQSGSREVLLKSAKKMANQETSMENTLSNLRQIEKLLDRALDQGNVIERQMEETTVVRDQMVDLTSM